MTAPRSNDRGAILAFPLGRRATARRPPAGPAGNPLLRGCRLRMEPAESKGCDWCSGTLPMPVAWALLGPPGAPRHRYRHPVPGSENRQEQDGGKGVGIPMAALQAAPPWRIPWARGKPAGNRRLPFSDRGFTAAVRMAKEAPPACWRCFRHFSPGGRRPPWLE
ncbi:hypothetical protein NDU88_000622 [Pleurodeles waltl]|uniref:Uncharacterized protein n=1 Tax=Pleurodeles waltl TaxID=8319 RepID=A0AAV7TG96_PLEWA|nr:hypothetical protein NDU88_000622 [Pleurodeles waltl]